MTFMKIIKKKNWLEIINPMLWHENYNIFSYTLKTEIM